MELAIFYELFAQLGETIGERCDSVREFVDCVWLLVYWLNIIVPRLISNWVYIAILLI